MLSITKVFRILAALLAAADALAAGGTAAGANPKTQAQNPQAQNATDAAPIILRNGDMSQGFEAPALWDNRWTGKGKLRLSRDTSVLKEKPASLCLESEGWEAQGQTAQMVDAMRGRKFVVSGWVKSAGKVKVNVFVQPFRADYTPIAFTQLQYAQNDTDWTAFRKEVVLPAETARFGLGVLLEGEGKAWLNGVKLSGENVRNEGIDPASVPTPAVQDPTVPMYGYFAQYPQAWMNFHKMYVAEAKKGKAQIVFLGDSITQGWTDGGKAEWEKRFAPLGSVDFGIGGDRTQQILWRIQHGTLDGLNPRLVVLLIGVNNLWADVGKYGVGKVVAGKKAIVEAVRARCPHAKILVLGTLPTQQDPKNSLRTLIQDINAQTARLDNGRTVRYADIGAKFLEPDGTISKDIMPDFLHPNARGYAIFADAIEPTIAQMLH